MSLAENHRLLNSIDCAVLVDCGCDVYVWKDGSGAEIKYCPMHEASPVFLDVLIFLDTAIMPEERKYDEWGYCRIHHDILTEFAIKVKAAIAKSEGDTK